jgi:hypothetical protein
MSDIKYINGKYYDFGCKNQSFLKTAFELKQLQVKNYYFMLEIINPRVADIDPFKPNISKEEVQALMMELKNNLWFYARSVAKLRSDAGVVQFELHRGLAASLWCFNNNLDACLCEPRQTWKTSGIIATTIGWSFQLSQNLNIHFFGKESENTKRNLATLKDDIDLLPNWLQFKRYLGDDGREKKTRQSTEILANNLFHNRLVIHPKPSSQSHAQGMARGASAAILYFDEIEHTPFFDELLSNSAPAFKTAADNARATGKKAARIFSSTPGNLDTREGMVALPIIKSMIPWTEKIYDMTEKELNEYKSAYRESYHSDENNKSNREVVDIFYLEYQYYQVRKTYEWVMEQYSLSGDKMAIRREILLQRLRGSTDSPIDPEDIEYLISNMVKSDHDIIINLKWRFRLYEHGQGTISGVKKDLDENIPYIVGIDPSGGGGGDNVAITILNPYNLKIAAEFRSPYISGTDLCRVLVTLVNDYIPKAVIIPEKNSMGIYLIQMICDNTSIRENLYWSESARQLEGISEESSDDYELKLAAEQYKKYGTYLTKKVRDAMIHLLMQHIQECKQILCTEYLVDDICKLVRTSTGKIQAVAGEHDDSLFSYLHAIYIYYTGDNLPAFGIIKEDHPILGPIEDGLDNTIVFKDTMSGFFSTKDVTYEEIALKDRIRMEEQIKYLVESNPNVYDEVYSNISKDENRYDNTVSIPSYYFDLVNGEEDLH